MRGFVKTVSAVLAACAALVSLSATADAQEIQLTGPLAGAPAVRKLRLHRKGRFEVAVGSSFTLLDQYLRTIMPGLTLTYHPTDWLGFGVWGGYGFQYSTGLADELQSIINDPVRGRNCADRPSVKACQLTAVNLTRNNIASDQLGHIKWAVAPQVVFIPFRGKISFFSALFVDTDVNIFAGPAIVGLQERAPCGKDTDGNNIALDPNGGGGGPCANQASFALANRVTATGTFGLGLNFYPVSVPLLGLGAEFRALPFSWNTSGFDNHGGGNNKDFPDNNVNGADREFHFNTMITVHVKLSFPASIKTSE